MFMAIRPFFDRGSAEERPRIGGRLSGGQVCVPVFGAPESRVADQTRLGLTIASANGGSVHLVDPMDEQSARRIEKTESDAGTAVEWATDRMSLDGRAHHGGVLSGRRAAQAVLDYIRTEEIDTLVLPSGFGRGPLGRRRHDRLAARAPCEVVSVNGKGRYRDFASLLLPIADGPHSGLATDVAASVAEHFDAWIDILHVLPTDPEAETRQAAETRMDRITERIGRQGTVNPWLLEADNPAETIIEQSAYYGLTVIGAPTTGRLKRFFNGSVSRRIRNDAESVVIAARTPQTQE